MRKKILLLFSACLIFGIFYWLNTKNSVTNELFEKRNTELLKYIEEVYKINAQDFKISSLTHFNDSLYTSIDERLSDNDLQFVLFIPQNYCQDCIIRLIDRFKSLPAFMQDKIIIMTAFERERDVRMWISSHKYRYPVYNSLTIGTSDFSARKRLTLFLANSAGIPSNFFMPERITPDISNNYFNFVISEFEKKMGIRKSEEELSGNEKPEIKVNNKHDFGELNLRDKVFTCFEFENLSPAPLIINDVRTNCGCTVSAWDKNPAGKGGILKVKVEFVAETVGIFSKRITVFSNAKDSPHSLTITGDVKKRSEENGF